MPDNLHIRRPQDPTKINVHESWEVQYWTHKWGVSRAQIEAAVRAVGTGTAAVARYLGKQA
jgi:Protein of unknown function (DUF3606)